MIHVTCFKFLQNIEASNKVIFIGLKDTPVKLGNLVKIKIRSPLIYIIIPFAKMMPCYKT